MLKINTKKLFKNIIINLMKIIHSNYLSYIWLIQIIYKKNLLNFTRVKQKKLVILLLDLK